MLTNDELLEMKETLSADVIDDPEEILNWFAENGVKMIDELLRRRDYNE